MKWKNKNAYYMMSDEGYKVCICYLKRSLDIDVPHEVRYVAWAPDKPRGNRRIKPENLDPRDTQAIKNAASLGVFESLNEAQKCCEMHFLDKRTAQSERSEILKIG